MSLAQTWVTRAQPWSQRTNTCFWDMGCHVSAGEGACELLCSDTNSLERSWTMSTVELHHGEKLQTGVGLLTAPGLVLVLWSFPSR